MLLLLQCRLICPYLYYYYFYIEFGITGTFNGLALLVNKRPTLPPPPPKKEKIWNASRFSVSSLRRGHANLLCIFPILVYVFPKRNYNCHTCALLTPSSCNKCLYHSCTYTFLHFNHFHPSFPHTTQVPHILTRRIC